MQQKRLQWMVGSVVLLSFMLLLALSACSLPGSSNSATNTTGNTGGTTSGSVATVTPQHGTTTVATPAGNTNSSTGNKNGPVIITTPSPAPGGNAHSQVILLKDRTITITNITKKSGMDASSVAISLTMTVKNIGGAAISNKSSFYQLMGAEGDVFGQQSSVTPDFLGSINAGASRSGTIVFQVPGAAATNLRLFYRSEQAQVVFAALFQS